MFWYFNPHFRKGSDDRCICYVVENKYFNPHFRKGSDISRGGVSYSGSISIHTSAREVTHALQNIIQFWWFQSTLPQGKWLLQTKEGVRLEIFQSTLPQGKWLQYFTKTSVYFYEISINIFEFTFVYYWNTLSIQKAHSNLFIFTGASLPVILCMLDTRTCKL